MLSSLPLSDPDAIVVTLVFVLMPSLFRCDFGDKEAIASTVKKADIAPNKCVFLVRPNDQQGYLKPLFPPTEMDEDQLYLYHRLFRDHDIACMCHLEMVRQQLCLPESSQYNKEAVQECLKTIEKLTLTL